MDTVFANGLTAKECREIVAKGIADGSMSYPGGGSDPPEIVDHEAKKRKHREWTLEGTEATRKVERSRQMELRKRRLKEAISR